MEDRITDSLLSLSPHVYSAVMCNSGTNARTNVKAQGVLAQSEGLPKDDPVPEMAEDGCPAG